MQKWVDVRLKRQREQQDRVDRVQAEKKARAQTKKDKAAKKRDKRSRKEEKRRQKAVRKAVMIKQRRRRGLSPERRVAEDVIEGVLGHIIGPEKALFLNLPTLMKTKKPAKKYTKKNKAKKEKLPLLDFSGVTSSEIVVLSTTAIPPGSSITPLAIPSASFAPPSSMNNFKQVSPILRPT